MAKMSVESVWDYPRPPRVEPSARHIVIAHAGITIADTSRAMRLLETSHPPTYYIPQADLAMHLLCFCEFKGIATYWNLQNGDKQLDEVAWSYASPTAPYVGLKDHLAFYAGRVDACTVDGELVLPQPGDFYGGWITSHVSGPFKGAPGTLGW
jgi:uncharacterized protein (DUF427 family)